MKIDGGCHCGAIRFEAEIDPAKVAICHCTDCQTLSGTAFRTVVPASGDQFKLLSGKPKIYVKTAESGNKRQQAFCGECGTPIYSAAIDNTPAYSLRVGAIRQRGELKPRVQYWCRSALGWLPELGEKKFPTALPPG
jgi:hypothetical protein